MNHLFTKSRIWMRQHLVRIFIQQRWSSRLLSPAESAFSAAPADRSALPGWGCTPDWSGPSSLLQKARPPVASVKHCPENLSHWLLWDAGVKRKMWICWRFCVIETRRALNPHPESVHVLTLTVKQLLHSPLGSDLMKPVLGLWWPQK